MLKIEGLVKKYQGQLAVNHVDLNIEQGDIFGLLGPNGAGKSSLLRMVTGITLPDEGQVTFDNEAFEIKKHMSQIGYMPEERGLYKKMKVREQLTYLARLKDVSKQDAHNQINYWFDRLEMHNWANKKVEDLSKGMSQKLQFVATVLHKPKLLILDEPFSGLDPVNTGVIKQEIFQLAQQGTTIIFSTHRMEQVEEVCKNIALMDKGSVILEGEMNEVKQRFKKKQYRLVLENEVHNLPFEIIEKTFDKNYVVQMRDGQKSNDVLRYCVENNLEIHSFNEILPSLNDIFISLVNQSANRQFETK